MAARFVQGFAGGWAMVIGRAIIVDLATGAQLVRVLNVIAGVGDIAPIVGPSIGAVILQPTQWRCSSWVVAALGLAMTVAVFVAVPVTAPRAAARWRPAELSGRRPRSSDTAATWATRWSLGRPWAPCSRMSPPQRSYCSR